MWSCPNDGCQTLRLPPLLCSLFSLTKANQRIERGDTLIDDNAISKRKKASKELLSKI